jgi:fructose-bisphosphate aldolase, class I
MNERQLIDTANALMADHKGLLAMDESTGTCDKRFAEQGIPKTEDMRRRWRDLIVTTPGLGDSISGAILFDETIRQKTLAGVPFAAALRDAGIIPGIKVDAGAKPLAFHPDEMVTEGLDGLRQRLEEYATMGARFAKWRAVITIGAGIPTATCIDVNAHALARYAALCQDCGIVPIVEPEVLMDGDHSLARCLEVTTETLRAVFRALPAQGVLIEGIILKPNMVVSGLRAATQASVDEVAAATVQCFLETVPAEVPGIAFLSGGQSAALASARLNAINASQGSRLKWPVTFSYSRAIQQPALDLWKGKPENVAAAQQALGHRAICNRAARMGKYDAARDAPAA